MNNPLHEIIPVEKRRYVYFTYAIIGLLLGAIQVGIATIPDTGQPVWLLVALNVYAYIGVGLGLTAGSNATSEDD